jgi:hypothetical protein
LIEQGYLLVVGYSIIF